MTCAQWPTRDVTEPVLHRIAAIADKSLLHNLEAQDILSSSCFARHVPLCPQTLQSRAYRESLTHRRLIHEDQCINIANVIPDTNGMGVPNGANRTLSASSAAPTRPRGPSPANGPHVAAVLATVLAAVTVAINGAQLKRSTALALPRSSRSCWCRGSSLQPSGFGGAASHQVCRRAHSCKRAQTQPCKKANWQHDAACLMCDRLPRSPDVSTCCDYARRFRKGVHTGAGCMGVVYRARCCGLSSQLGQGKDVRCVFAVVCPAICPNPGILKYLRLQMLQMLSFWSCWQAWVHGGRRKLPTSSRCPVETISRMLKHAVRPHLISGP